MAAMPKVSVLVALAPLALAAAAPSPEEPVDEETGAALPGTEIAFHLEDPQIRESSGLVTSHLHEDIFYTHNDSGPEMTPDIFAVDGDGEIVATLRVTGAGVEARDWEAVAIGEGPDGEPAIFVGDIGDNFDGAWPNVRVYRFSEPENLVDQEVGATVFTFTYEDGGRDAEAMFIDPRDNRLYITSKEVAGGLYTVPEELTADGSNELTRVDPAPTFATGASISPDGETYIIRTYWGANVYDASAGIPGPVLGRLALPQQDQGEGIAHIGDGSAVLVSSEGEHTPVWRVELSEEYGGTPEPDPEEPDPEETADAEPAASEEPATSGAGTAIALGAGVAVLIIAGIVALVRRA